MNNLVKIITSGLYLGYIPIASGTFGTLLGIPIVLLLNSLGRLYYIIAIFLLIPIGSWFATQGEIIFKKEDSGKIVIDEIIGYIITMFLIPEKPWYYLVIGFFLFRFFDIIKLYPASYFDQKVKGGLGVVLDDCIAGIYANITFQLSKFILNF